MKYCYLIISVRLACLIHAASVRSEPESNSPIENMSCLPQVAPRKPALNSGQYIIGRQNVLVTTSASSLHPNRHPHLRLSTRARTVTRTIQSSFELLLSIVSLACIQTKEYPVVKEPISPQIRKNFVTEIKGKVNIRPPNSRSMPILSFFS